MRFEDTFFGRPNTIRTYTSLYRSHLKEMVEQADTSKWNDEMTLYLLDVWKEKGLARRTQITLLRILSKYLKFTSNVSFDVKRYIRGMDRSEQQEETKAFTKEEARRLMTACRQLEPLFYPLLLLGLHAGLRPGEVYGLRCGDVDLLRGRVRVAHSYDGPTKSGKTRFVPLSPELIDVIQGARNLFFRATEDVIFERFDPNPVMRRLCAHARARSLTFHSLRHTFATLALESGTSPKQVQLWLGHANLATTLNVYWNIIHDKATLDFLPNV